MDLIISPTKCSHCVLPAPVLPSRMQVSSGQVSGNSLLWLIITSFLSNWFIIFCHQFMHFSLRRQTKLFIYEMWKKFVIVLLLTNKKFPVSLCTLQEKLFENYCESYLWALKVKMNYHRASSPRQGSFNCWRQSIIDFIHQFDLLNNTSRVGLKENLDQFIFCWMCPLFYLSFWLKNFIHWLNLFWELRQDKTFHE